MGRRPPVPPFTAERRGTALARLILATSALIAVERASARWGELVAPDDDVAIASITAAELLAGVELADTAHRPGRQAFVERILNVVPIEDCGLSAARAHAILLTHTGRSGRMRGAHALVIAAVAVSARRTIISRDTSAFEELPGVNVRVVS